MRGFAIVWIVWQSSCGDFELTDLTSKLLALFTNTGWVGIQFFFVLSGFLITGKLVDGIGRERHFRDFYLGRMLRIFPLYYMVLTTYFIVMPLMGKVFADHSIPDDMGIYFWTLSVNWTLIFLEVDDGLMHLWSIAVIAQYYLLWPLLVTNLNSRKLLIVFQALVVIAVVSRFAIVNLFPDVYIDYNHTYTIARMDSLAIGSLLAIMLRDEKYFAWLKQNATTILLISTVSVLFIVGKNEQFHVVGTGVAQLNQTLSAIVFALLIYYIVQLRQYPAMERPGSTPLRWLSRIGKYSFAIYMFHLPVKELFRSLFFVSPENSQGIQLLLILLSNWAAVFVASFLLAMVSWHLIEAPLQKKGDRLRFAERP